MKYTISKTFSELQIVTLKHGNEAKWYVELEIAGTGYVQGIWICSHFLGTVKAYKSCIKNTGHFLKQSTNRPNFWFFQIVWRADDPGPAQCIETGVGERKAVWQTHLAGYHFSLQRHQVCVDPLFIVTSSFVFLRSRIILHFVLFPRFVF